MRRKLFCMLFAVLMLGVTVLPVSAATGTIRVDIGGKGEVTVYKVGEAEGTGYRLSEQYGGGFATFDDVLSPNLAAWMAQRAEDGISRETELGVAEFGSVEEGLYLVVQSGQREGYDSFSPFLLCLPWDGAMWDVEVTPKMEQSPAETPQTGEGFALLSGAGGMAASLAGLAACLARKGKRK